MEDFSTFITKIEETFKNQLPEDEEDFNTVLYNIEETIYQQFDLMSSQVLYPNFGEKYLGVKNFTP